MEPTHTIKIRLKDVDVYNLTAAISPVNYIDTVMPHREVITWVQWINRNICRQLESDDWMTTDVKVRIATGMLNKIHCIDKITKIQLHSNLIRNLTEERNLIIDESLPF